VEADCAGTRSGDCHLQQLKNTRKKAIFNREKHVPDDFCSVSRVVFKGVEKEKKTSHNIIGL
jgi:hypothetical protein